MDEKPDKVSRVLLEDLDKLGKTEMVSVLIPLRSLKADEIGPEIKKMLGPWGDVVILKSANKLIVSDRAGNLRRIYEVIKDADQRKRR